MSTCTRKECDNEIDREQLARVHGEYSSVMLGGYCSAQCYTADVISNNSKPPRIKLSVEVPKSKLDKLTRECDEKSGGHVSVEAYLRHLMCEALKGAGLSINHAEIKIGKD